MLDNFLFLCLDPDKQSYLISELNVDVKSHTRKNLKQSKTYLIKKITIIILTLKNAELEVLSIKISSL